MKTTVSAIGILVLFLGGSLAFAQMSGGMMKDQSGTMSKGQSSTMQHGEQHGMMDHGQMMGGMIDMSNQMAEMTGKISATMKDMPAGDMKKMSHAMNDMSHQMLEMSVIMGNGKITAAEMKKIQDQMTKIQREMPEMDMHK